MRHRSVMWLLFFILISITTIAIVSPQITHAAENDTSDGCPQGQIRGGGGGTTTPNRNKCYSKAGQSGGVPNYHEEGDVDESLIPGNGGNENPPADPAANTGGTIIAQGNTPTERANSYCTQYADHVLSAGHQLDRGKLVDACKKGYSNGNPSSQVCTSLASQGRDYQYACQNGYVGGASSGCRSNNAVPPVMTCDNTNLNEDPLVAEPGARNPGGGIAGTGYNGGDTKCSKVDTGIVNCDDNAGVLGPLIFFIRVMSVCVGIAAVGGIAWGGFKYATAQGNSDQVAQAISTIRNTVVGLLIFASLVAVANFIAPVRIFG